jgi:hypothetical protein
MQIVPDDETEFLQHQDSMNTRNDAIVTYELDIKQEMDLTVTARKEVTDIQKELMGDEVVDSETSVQYIFATLKQGFSLR